MQALELQATQMADMESQINHISETVAIHREKVARREIGILTSNKVNARQHKILVPANPERPLKYVRRPIDFALLDDVGHGVHVPRTRPSRPATHAPPPTTKPPTPPTGVRCGTLSRASKEYRTPIAPPIVPSNYAPNFPIGHHARDTLSRRGSGYASGQAVPVAPVATAAAAVVHPLPADCVAAAAAAPLPPPPPEPLTSARDAGSPPLPPPPPPDPQAPQAATQAEAAAADWVPRVFLEKVVAMYDYSAARYDELSFQENAVIYVVKKNDDGWYEGVLNGITGLFPGNYVEPCL